MKSGEEANRLLTEAGDRLQAANLSRPNSPDVAFNLACFFALRNSPENAVAWLSKWKLTDPRAARSKVAADPDFDGIREAPALQAFIRSLPD
jgi:Flp pilus assembly protein TadD